MAAVNIILEVLIKMKALYPSSSFIQSLYDHYCNKGGLSKNQLEGLLDKMLKTPEIEQGKIATIEAIILKKPIRERAKPTITSVALSKDETLGKLMENILQKYPLHKRILFLKSKYDKNEAISIPETEEIKRLHKLLIK